MGWVSSAPSPCPGAGEKYWNLSGVPLKASASGGAARFTAMFGQVSAYSALSLSHFSRPGSVSAKTYALVVGRDPGAAKLSKAEACAVPILDETGFIALLERGEIA